MSFAPVPPRPDGSEPTGWYVRPVLGLPLAALDYVGVVRAVLAWAEQDITVAVEAANTHVTALARHDPAFGTVMRSFTLVLPDGMPLVWCLNRRLRPDLKLRDRVYGPTLMLRCLAATTVPDAPGHFLLGGSEELLAELTASLTRRFPGVRIAGSYAPPFGPWDEVENGRIKERITTSGARLIWVGLGCPKQEQWISRHLSSLPAGVYFGVGAAFAFHAGRVRQAPAVLQKFGLEWVFRLAVEPRRLWRRYIIYNSLFLFYLAWDRLTGKTSWTSD